MASQTYLVGNQFQGESTVEGYIRALEQGCRSVERESRVPSDGFRIVRQLKFHRL